MKKIVKILVASVLLTCLLINSVFAVSDWGVDEKGKFSYKYILVVVKDEHTNEPETVMEHIKTELGVEEIEIISDTADAEQPLILLVYLPVLSEEYFYSVYDALETDPYVDFVFKDYYLGPFVSYLRDVNQDGKIQTDDTRTILMYAAGQLDPTTKTQKILANADGDGVITTQDARYALSVACGII